MSRDQRSSGPILGRPVKMLGSLIGAGTEAYAHHKAKKEAASAQQAQPQSSQRSASHEREEQLDDEDWALDDASGELNPKAHRREHIPLLETPGLDMPTNPLWPLPCPVVLPQRRPQTKSRGFVRAYAPLLGQCKGIDEATFLEFLEEFFQQTQASQYLQVINVAAGFVGMVPSVIAMATSTALNVGAKAGIEAQTRYKTNTYLDLANEKLFNPRNLHCVIMTFKPDSSQKLVNVDMSASNEAIVTSLDTPSDSKWGKMKGSHGTSKGEFAIPEAAPLVYPTIDKAAFAVSEDGKPLPAEKQNAFKRSSAFIKDYLDRRAEAEFAGTQGDGAKLNVPGATDQQKFASRYADPNHPANSGSILALLTGGAVDPRAGLLTRRADLAAKVQGRQLTEQDRQNVAMGRGAIGGGRPSVLGSMRKVLKEDVLYLLIAEIPSPKEMEEMERKKQNP